MGEYADFVLQLDWVVGQINNALVRTRLDRQTILVFTSDNAHIDGDWPEPLAPSDKSSVGTGLVWTRCIDDTRLRLAVSRATRPDRQIHQLDHIMCTQSPATVAVAARQLASIVYDINHGLGRSGTCGAFESTSSGWPSRWCGASPNPDGAPPSVGRRALSHSRRRRETSMANHRNWYQR